MQDKIKNHKTWHKSSLHLHTHTHTHTYSLCTVHVILNKIIKANNLAFFSHHVLLWPCVRTGCPTLKLCLIVIPTPYWTILWYFSNIWIGCNHFKKHALNMGHKKTFRWLWAMLCSRGLNLDCLPIKLKCVKLPKHAKCMNFCTPLYVFSVHRHLHSIHLFIQVFWAENM